MSIKILRDCANHDCVYTMGKEKVINCSIFWLVTGAHVCCSLIPIGLLVFVFGQYVPYFYRGSLFSNIYWNIWCGVVWSKQTASSNEESSFCYNALLVNFCIAALFTTIGCGIGFLTAGFAGFKHYGSKRK